MKHSDIARHFYVTVEATEEANRLPTQAGMFINPTENKVLPRNYFTSQLRT